MESDWEEGEGRSGRSVPSSVYGGYEMDTASEAGDSERESESVAGDARSPIYSGGESEYGEFADGDVDSVQQGGEGGDDDDDDDFVGALAAVMDRGS